MCGDTIIEKLQAAWLKYLPVILDGTPSTDELKAQYEAFKIIDKKLRPPGTASKAAAAFSLHPVSELCIDQ